MISAGQILSLVSKAPIRGTSFSHQCLGLMKLEVITCLLRSTTAAPVELAFACKGHSSVSWTNEPGQHYMSCSLRSTTAAIVGLAFACVDLFRFRLIRGSEICNLMRSACDTSCVSSIQQRLLSSAFHLFIISSSRLFSKSWKLAWCPQPSQSKLASAFSGWAMNR